ncbi:MAG: hypothetical protein FD149_2494 [Rhodospirillaceae bacterium]|nr:MAG: hypothetical protein FD149_2494 [Rhodospirillaceae bacterium]
MFVVTVNDRPLQTPEGAPLAVPNRALADVLSAEWREHGDRPLTRLANTAIDRMPVLRLQALEAVLVFAATDLVCHWADAPLLLVERQRATWQPLLDLVAQRHQAHLMVTAGVMPIAQPRAAFSALRDALKAMDSFHLTVLHEATVLSGSLVIALSLIEGAIDAEAAFRAAQLDALFQAERWGLEAETAARHDSLQAELRLCARFVTLLGA